MYYLHFASYLLYSPYSLPYVIINNERPYRHTLSDSRRRNENPNCLFEYKELILNFSIGNDQGETRTHDKCQCVELVPLPLGDPTKKFNTLKSHGRKRPKQQSFKG